MLNYFLDLLYRVYGQSIKQRFVTAIPLVCMTMFIVGSQFAMADALFFTARGKENGIWRVDARGNGLVKIVDGAVEFGIPDLEFDSDSQMVYWPDHFRILRTDIYGTDLQSTANGYDTNRIDAHALEVVGDWLYWAEKNPNGQPRDGDFLGRIDLAVFEQVEDFEFFELPSSVYGSLVFDSVTKHFLYANPPVAWGGRPWGGPGTIGQVELNGDTATLVDGIVVGEVEFDPVNRFLYWNRFWDESRLGCIEDEFEVEGVYRRSLNEENTIEIAQGPISSIAIDLNNQQLYYVHVDEVMRDGEYSCIDVVGRLPLLGGEPETLFETNFQISNLTFAPGVQAGADCNGDGELTISDLVCVPDTDSRDEILTDEGIQLGDIDGDGIAAFADFLILSQNFGLAKPNYTDGNLNLANGVDFADFLILSTHFSAPRVMSVPETSGRLMTVVILVTSGVLFQRRSKNKPFPRSSPPPIL